MKYYGQEFMIEGIFPSPYPTKAHTWDSLEQAFSQYEEFVADCKNSGHTPMPHWLYEGTAKGDETILGYPDWPDKIIRVNLRDKVIIEEIA